MCRILVCIVFCVLPPDLGRGCLVLTCAFVMHFVAAGTLLSRHFCGRALVRLCPQLAIAMSWQCQSVVLLPQQSLQRSVPEPWIDSLLPGVRTVLGEVQARNARLQSGKPQSFDKDVKPPKLIFLYH